CARTVGGLHDPIAFGPRFHRYRCPMLVGPHAGRERLPAGLSTAAATTAVPTHAAAAKSTPAAESTFGLRPRRVHRERPPTELLLMTLGCGFLRFLIGRHLDERDPSRAPGCRIPHHPHRFHRASPAEQLLQLRLARGVRKIPDVQPATHTISSSNAGA